MSAGACEHKCKDLLLNLVYQQPIRSNMTFSETAVFAG
jgi:hypothetical protein